MPRAEGEADVGRQPGRPRSPAVDASILEATLAEYADRGFHALTVDRVAARAGVGKAAVYRRYESKVELVAAAMYANADKKPYPDTGTVDGDVRGILQHLHGLVNDPVVGRCLRHMAADATTAPDLGAVHAEFVHGRRAGTKAVLQRAIDRGELRADTDLDIATDVLTGPVFYRHLMGHMPVDGPFLDQLVTTFLQAFAS